MEEWQRRMVDPNWGGGKFGAPGIGGEELIFSTKIDLEYIQGVLQQYVIGSIILSLIVGFIFFILSYLFLSKTN